MSDPEDIKRWRKARRAELLAKRLAITKAEYSQRTAAITQWLKEGFPILQGMIVGFYWPFQGEFDPRFAVHRFRKDGAITALPVVVQKGAPLQFRVWNPGVTVSKGVFNLPVPEGTSTVIPQALLIPPVGFDLKGYRLGYGGGYFDRTLAALQPQPLKIGVAFELSRVETIHPQAFDVPMDFIVTEAGIHHVTDSGLAYLRDAHEAIAIAHDIVRRRERTAHQQGKVSNDKHLVDVES